MSMDPSQSLYSRQLDAALRLYYGEKMAEAVRAAKYNLSDPTLPRFYQINNCAIVILAEDDWDEAEKYRQAAEKVWQAAKLRTGASDLVDQRTLAQLRTTLDNIARTMKLQEPPPLDDTSPHAAVPEHDEGWDEEEEDEYELEDEEAVREAEAELRGPELDIIGMLQQSVTDDRMFHEDSQKTNVHPTSESGSKSEPQESAEVKVTAPGELSAKYVPPNRRAGQGGRVDEILRKVSWRG